MISLITTMFNRARLFENCLEAIFRNSYPSDKKEIEINVLDDGSTDGLDTLLQRESKRFGTVNKYTWNRDTLARPIQFNCPAQAYNLLVKLANYPVVYKTDPEMVILDRDFIKKALLILETSKTSDAIVMPFPYHCYEFSASNLEDIENYYTQFVYPTHITKENANYQMVYYQGIFKRTSYMYLGGVDERFSSSIGSEDCHFLDWWKRLFGEHNFVPLVDSPCVHQFHGGMASGPKGVPAHLYRWVEQGERLRQDLSHTKPNDGLEWGKIPQDLVRTQWIDGKTIEYYERYKS